ncbi:MAG: SRPBCC family protein [Chlorobium sp.]|nr:SRPBCC family protein [Chlorobium sp.]
MAFQVEITVEKKFSTAASVERVYTLLADVPRSASHFPKVEKFVDLGGNAYRWEMEKIGIGGHTLHETVYACLYTADPKTHAISWTPVAGVGNGLVEGGWSMALKGEETVVTLHTKGILTVDLPSFLQFLLSPLVVMEFNLMIEQYLQNLAATLNAE